MTSITAPPPVARPVGLEPVPARPGFGPRTAPAIVARLRADAGLLGVGLLATVLYLWNLAISGYANTYYTAAVVAASQSWGAWFFGSLDAGNFITVDKPPLSTMLMGI